MTVSGPEQMLTRASGRTASASRDLAPTAALVNSKMSLVFKKEKDLLDKAFESKQTVSAGGFGRSRPRMEPVGGELCLLNCF